MSVAAIPPPPDLKASHPEVVAVAAYLRNNQITKQRPALLGGQRFDMFKVKRAVRALLDPAYERAKKSNPNLPDIPDRAAALQTIARLPADRFALNVIKLETEDALAKNLKPQSGVPVVLISPQQRVGDPEYMVWFYNPTPLMTYVYGVGLLAGFAALALYQLWPNWARRGSYYVSLGALVLVGVLLAISVVRLVVFVLSLVVLPKGFWLLPNLYADVGFFQSFRPVYAWSGEKTLPVKVKPKKRKSKAAQGAGPVPAGAVPGVVPGAVPGMPGPGGPVPVVMRQTPNGPVPVQLPPGAMPAPGKPGQFVMHPMMQQLMSVALDRAKMRFMQIVQTNPPKSEAEAKELQRTLVQEEGAKVQQELMEAQQRMQPQ